MTGTASAERTPEHGVARVLGWSALIGFIALGVALRLRRYLDFPPFRLDEALLVENVIRRDFLELLQPMDWHQNSPFAFLYALKLVYLALGSGEWQFRLIPLVSGLIALPLFAWFVAAMGRGRSARHAMPWAVLLSGMALFAGGKWLVYWSSEVRHYSTDVVITCVLYLMALHALRSDERSAMRRFLPLLLVGLMVTWFSLSAIFILGGIGATFLFVFAYRKEWRSAAWAGGACAVWLASFFAQLAIHNHNLAARDLSHDIEATLGIGFLPIPSESFLNFKWFRETFELMFWKPGGLTYRGLAGFAFLAGCVAIAARDRVRASMLLLPFAFGLVAAALHRYPFWERYLLYLVPILFYCMAEGVALLLRQRDRRLVAAGSVLLALLLAQPYFRAAQEFARPYGENEMHELVAHVQANWQEGDLLYLDWFENIPFVHYNGRYGFSPEEYELEEHFCEQYADNEAFRAVYRARRLPELLAEHPRVWVLHGHDGAPVYALPPGEDWPVGEEVEAHFASGVSLHLFVPEDAAE